MEVRITQQLGRMADNYRNRLCTPTSYTAPCCTCAQHNRCYANPIQGEQMLHTHTNKSKLSKKGNKSIDKSIKQALKLPNALLRHIRNTYQILLLRFKRFLKWRSVRDISPF